ATLGSRHATWPGAPHRDCRRQPHLRRRGGALCRRASRIRPRRHRACDRACPDAGQILGSRHPAPRPRRGARARPRAAAARKGASGRAGGGGDDALPLARSGCGGGRRRRRRPRGQGGLRVRPDAAPRAALPRGAHRMSNAAELPFGDLSEREDAVAQARRVSQMYAALSAANEASAQIKDERHLYQRICDIVVQFGGMRLASVRLPRPGSHWLDTCAYAGAAASYLLDARISTHPALPPGQGLAGPAQRENRANGANDCLAEPRLAPWHAGARRFGFASVACVPLRRAGTAIAMLALYAAETGYFDAELVTLVERMAANVGHALDRLDAERRMRESEARFRSLANLNAALSSANEAILRASSPDELLSRACEIAVAAGNFVLGTVFLFDQASGKLRRVAKSGPAAAYPLTENPIYDSFVVASWQSGEAMVANDYQSDPRTRRRREHPRPYPHHLGAGA